MIDITKLTEDELINLKLQVIKELDNIKQSKIDDEKRKNSIIKKTKLSELKEHDVIFGIGISSGLGHRLKESDNDIVTTWFVHIMDYCKVTEYTDKKYTKSDYHRINISHGKKPFGLGTSLSDEAVDKHYLLSLCTSTNGYDQFYTLRPETWKEDIVKAYHGSITERKKWWDRDVTILNDKLQVYLNEQEKITNYINNLNN